MKKKYMKPNMKVYDLKQKPQLLAGSTPDYNGPIGYSPDINSNGEFNHLA